MSDPRNEIERHLRGASDAVLLLAREVEQLEQHKRGVQPEDPHFDDLARSVRATADALAEFTREEESWARGAAASRADLTPIARTPDNPSLARILERWRAIERQLDEATPGSPEAIALFEEFQLVRQQYMTAFHARERSNALPDGTSEDGGDRRGRGVRWGSAG
jgi:hypothetical protein